LHKAQEDLGNYKISIFRSLKGGDKADDQKTMVRKQYEGMVRLDKILKVEADVGKYIS
jgi:hypothetical protein